MIRQRHKKRRTFVLLLALALTLLAGCAAKESGEVTALSQLGEAGRKIGVPGDLLEYERLKRDYPQAEVLAYDNYPLAYKDVAEGRLDAYIYARRQMEFAIANGTKGVRLLPENYSENTVAVGLSPLSPIPGLQEKINAFIAALKADGTLDDMYTRWVVQGEDAMPEIALPAKPAYHLRVATTGTVMPFSYYAGPELRGYDIELARRFAAWLGADLAFRVSDFPGTIAAAAVGDVDCIMSNLYYSSEKGDAIPFSDPLFDVEITAMVRDTGAVPAGTQAEPRWQDYNGKRIGVLVGPLMEDLAHSCFPDSEYLLFDGYPECIAALLGGKIDAYLGDEPGLKSVHAERPEIDYIHDRITRQDYSFAFRKDDPKSAALCAELNAFLEKCRADGTIRELEDIWFGAEEARKVVDMRDLTGENGTIRVITTSSDMPWSYIKDGKNVGYDIDLVVRFCRDRGYALELGDADFAARIPAIQSGKYDFTTDMNVTPERREQVLFSDPTSTGGVVLAYLSGTGAQGNNAGSGKAESFLDGILSSLEKTFVRESRWKLFLRGFANTVLITVLSILFGTALGFLLLLWCRNGNPFANTVTRFCLWLVQGMPMVVLLMILYYVIFGSTAISGLAVAVIGFTLTFGAAVFGMLKMGVGSVDRGQYEAAYALGHSNRRTFFRIILPQAVPHVLPAYQGEIVGLVKATAVVGYIAVQDLTKMGDIVRSRTYEAFFPLISVTVIYFALEGLLSFLVGRLQIRMDPRKRSRERILKGVNTHDQA